MIAILVQGWDQRATKAQHQVTYPRKAGTRARGIFGISLCLPFNSLLRRLNCATYDGGLRYRNPYSSALGGSKDAKLRHFIKEGGALEA